MCFPSGCLRFSLSLFPFPFFCLVLSFILLAPSCGAACLPAAYLLSGSLSLFVSGCAATLFSTRCVKAGKWKIPNGNTFICLFYFSNSSAGGFHLLGTLIGTRQGEEWRRGATGHGVGCRGAAGSVRAAVTFKTLKLDLWLFGL